MSRFINLGVALVAIGLLFASLGCSKETPPSTPANSTTDREPAGTMPPPERPQQGEPATLPTEGNPAAEPGVEDQTAPAGDQAGSPEVQAALASLTAEDRALAVKQKICPVSGGALGSMGVPVKVHVAGQDVFICCEHCEQPLKDKPAEFLAKIGVKPAEDAAVQ